jgi:hypothetical protein
MTSDPELESWRRDWKSLDGIPPDLRRRVEQHIRAGRRAWWPPMMVTVVIGGGMFAWAVASGERVAVQTAVATWLFIVVTWATGVGILLRFGGRRRPEAATTIAFLDFAIRVCRATRAGIVAGAVLYALFLVFMLSWRFQTGAAASVSGYLLSVGVVVRAVVTVLLGLAAWRAHRRLGRELRSLLATQRQMADLPVSPETALDARMSR